MGACFYQFYYAWNRDYRPISYGSICVFACGIFLNFGFILNFTQSVKGKDLEFEKWRKKKWFCSNFMLIVVAFTSLTMYRLLICRIFGIPQFKAKMSRPQPFLRPILIFTWVKFCIFNIPLMIVNLIGMQSLAWPN